MSKSDQETRNNDASVSYWVIICLTIWCIRILECKIFVCLTASWYSRDLSSFCHFFDEKEIESNQDVSLEFLKIFKFVSSYGFVYSNHRNLICFTISLQARSLAHPILSENETKKELYLECTMHDCTISLLARHLVKHIFDDIFQANIV